MKTQITVVALSALMLCVLQVACTGSSTSTTPGAPAPGPGPAIVTQPANQTVTAGATAQFTVAASGSGTLSYQWQMGPSSSPTNISGGTGTTLTISNTTTAMNGETFRVIVKDANGSTTSNFATLTVSAADTKPTITTQPVSITVTAGQTATFSVVASGTPAPTYQWQQSSTDPTNISGATSASYTTPATTTANSGEMFRVVVTNSVGSVNSNFATLTVSAAPVKPTITTQPANQTVTAGQTATFTVVASGTAPLTYQWQEGSTNPTNISGATSASFTTPVTTTSNSGETFRVVVTNSAGSATSTFATLTVNAAAVKPTITTQPASQTVTAGQMATFTVAATGTGTLTYQWQQGSTSPTNISGATSASFTTPATTTSDSGEMFRVVVTDQSGSTDSNFVTLTVNPATQPNGNANVLMFHNDIGRTGQNLGEIVLTTANVNTTTFGKLGFMPVDGLVDAEPLYVSNLTIGGTAHNVVFVATEHDSVYAFDANTFAQLWKTSVLGSGETTSDDRGCSQIEPEIGISSTPVIDLTAGAHGTIFVVGMSKNSSSYFHRLHALDLTTGAEQSGSPTTIQATFQLPNTGSPLTTFTPAQYKDRAALLLLNGTIYTTWASHCDDDPYQAWIMGYSESTLQQTSALNITPNGSRGAFWGASAGPSADSSGNFYVLSGNGTFDDTLTSGGIPVSGDFGNGFLKISTANNGMSVADYFNMFDTDTESNNDTDLGSGGSIVLPDLKDSSGNTWQLAVGAGKDGRIYVVNRNMMGGFNTSNDNQIYQELDGALPGGVWSTSAYFNNTVYFGPVGNPLRAFSISNAKLSTSPSSVSSHSYVYPGATPSISANGTSNAILWVIENGSTGVLHAYDATNLATELYNSNQNTADEFTTNSSCKFVTPMIANGQVFVGTNTGVVVFGLR